VRYPHSTHCLSTPETYKPSVAVSSTAVFIAACTLQPPRLPQKLPPNMAGVVAKYAMKKALGKEMEKYKSKDVSGPYVSSHLLASYSSH
jgi:hypothetical protein